MKYGIRQKNALKEAMRDKGIDWIDAPGEGAFYGPKIECSLSDCLGEFGNVVQSKLIFLCQND